MAEHMAHRIWHRVSGLKVWSEQQDVRITSHTLDFQDTLLHVLFEMCPYTGTSSRACIIYISTAFKPLVVKKKSPHSALLH